MSRQGTTSTTPASTCMLVRTSTSRQRPSLTRRKRPILVAARTTTTTRRTTVSTTRPGVMTPRHRKARRLTITHPRRISHPSGIVPEYFLTFFPLENPEKRDYVFTRDSIYAIARTLIPPVCPSHALIASKQLNVSSKFFHCLIGPPIILVFHHQGSLRKSDGFTPNGGAEYKGSDFRTVCVKT